MTAYDLARARAAVQFLVDTSYGPQHITKIKAYVAKTRGLPFKEDQECLNELIEIGRQNPDALEALLAIVASKRSDKGAYQREFMAAKRKRDAKALKLKALLSGKKLDNSEKVAALSAQYGFWNAERDAYLAAQGELEWAARNAAIRTFWDTKEAELDELLGKAENPCAKSVAMPSHLKIVLPKK